MGCLLALTRRRPQATRFAAPIRLEPIGESAPDGVAPHAA